MTNPQNGGRILIHRLCDVISPYVYPLHTAQPDAMKCFVASGGVNWILRLPGGPKKWGHRPMTTILSNINHFTYFFTRSFLCKFVVKQILKIPPHLAYVATQPCEILVSAKQAINDKLQGSVATHLRCGGVVNNQTETGLLLSLSEKVFLIGEYLAKLLATAWLSRLANTLLKGEETGGVLGA